MNNKSPKMNSVEHRTFPFSASDVPFNDKGQVYHLEIDPSQLAPDILIVGDPGRSEMIGETFLQDIEFKQEHRGLVTVTGTSQISGEQATIISPTRSTVTTSGMGTSSLEVVLQELVALNEIDFQTRTPKTEFPRLQIIRVGTSGGLQESTKLGTPIITSYAVGMDNTGLFYECSYADEVCERLEKELHDLMKQSAKETSRFYGNIHPYVAKTEPKMVDAMSEAAKILGVECKVGLTVSCSGFFAPQGRDICRIFPSIVDMDKIFADYDPGLGGQRFENMEMETSFLTHFMGGLGYWAGSICTAIANRRRDTFDVHYEEAVRNSIRVALFALAINRKRYKGL